MTEDTLLSGRQSRTRATGQPSWQKSVTSTSSCPRTETKTTCTRLAGPSPAITTRKPCAGLTDSVLTWSPRHHATMDPPAV